ncbi:MAG: hypothetical protein WDM81_13830 [Rhizomicrobium sp.]
MNEGCIVYIVTRAAGEHALCVLAGGRFHSFPVSLANLARLNAESAACLLQAMHAGTEPPIGGG